MKVGDIFRSTWGYDQTNVDFYVVKRITPKMVELQQCDTKRVGDMTSWASDKVVPDPDNLFEGTFMRRVAHVRDSVMVRIDNVSCATLMKDPAEATHRSWYA